MGRGPRKHQKRVAAPSSWMLDKLSGVWAPKAGAGPHKARECLPLIVLLRNRLKFALTYTEAKQILMQRQVLVDGKARVAHTFPTGVMDVVSMPAMKLNYRILPTTKGRFAIHQVSDEEASYKLCRVQQVKVGAKSVPMLVAHDGRTYRFPDPAIKTNDTIRVEIATGKILDFLKFEVGSQAMTTKGNNSGRVGVIESIEHHPGSFQIVHLKDAAGNQFATRQENITVIGTADKVWISLPKGNGIKLTTVEDRRQRLA